MPLLYKLANGDDKAAKRPGVIMEAVDVLKISSFTAKQRITDSYFSGGP